MGHCYALELARQGIEILLVALSGSGLAEVVAASRQYGVDCVPFEADICNGKALCELCREIETRYPLFMIVNNAGTGGTKRFATYTPELRRRSSYVGPEDLSLELAEGDFTDEKTLRLAVRSYSMRFTAPPRRGNPTPITPINR